MKTTNWESPERSLELQPGDQPTTLLYDQAQANIANFNEQFLGIFQSLLIGRNFRFAHKYLTNLFMIITINFRLFLKKILVLLKMLIPPE